MVAAMSSSTSPPSPPTLPPKPPLAVLAAVLEASHSSLDSAASLLRIAGRPRCLAFLKAVGVGKLTDRQAMCGALGRAVKEGQLLSAPHVWDEGDPVFSALWRLTEDGELSLLDAAQHGRADEVALLCRVRADVEASRRQGRSALALASCEGHDSCMALLLAAHADPDRAGVSDGWTPLMWASHHGKRSSIDVLIHARASPSLAKPNGFAPLMAAAMAGHASCVSALLHATADAHATHQRDGTTTPFVLATEAGHATCAALLAHDGAGDGTGAGDGRVLADDDAAGDGCICTANARWLVRPGDLQCDETWMERPIGVGGVAGARGRLTYCVRSHTRTYANVLQVLLRANGFRPHAPPPDLTKLSGEERQGAERSPVARWSLCWLAGSLTAEACAALRPHQRVSKFPGRCPLVRKAELWRSFQRMRAAHAEEAYGYMPPTYILPDDLGSFEMAISSTSSTGTEAHLGGDLHVPPTSATAAAGACAWIFKPHDGARGDGIRIVGEGEGATSPLLDVARSHRGVVCAYLDDPFLIEGRKADLRLYVVSGPELELRDRRLRPGSISWRSPGRCLPPVGGSHLRSHGTPCPPSAVERARLAFAAGALVGGRTARGLPAPARPLPPRLGRVRSPSARGAEVPPDEFVDQRAWVPTVGERSRAFACWGQRRHGRRCRRRRRLRAFVHSLARLVSSTP